MNHVPFHLTRMGARFYEHTGPALARELERLNNNLEKLLGPVATPTPVDHSARTGKAEEGT